LLEEMLAPDRPIWDKADEIKEVEHKCDFITHEIIQRLHRTFVTPLDREDIHTLARTLDDVMDAIDASAAIVRLYQIERVRPDARELARLVAMSSEQVVIAMKALERRHGVAEPAVEINRLENEADRAHQNAVRRLFEEEQNPVAIIKWKEILDFLEAATDRCEDVANVLEGVVVKHA
jgi:predicted phosphate transport protein (TIGR00153 family)